MLVQFFLFIIIVLLISIFWELSKINARLRKAFHASLAVPVEHSLKAHVAPERG
jgi:hypothetical protein